MYIDCHVHGDPDNIEDKPETYVDSCRKRGIEAIVLIEPLNRCLKAVKKFGDFIIPVAQVNMDASSRNEVEKCIKAGSKGIKFIRPTKPYGDKRYWPLYDKLEKLNAVAVFHTGYVFFDKREMHPVWIDHMRAAQVDVVARRFPDLKILMAHFSNPWWEEAWKVSWTRENVYADLSGGTAIHRSTHMWSEMFAPDGVLLEDSIKKLCFASDVPYFHEGVFLFEPYITFYEKIFNKIGLSKELRELVNRGNAKALFGLS
jgi:hypothetical protein